MGSMSNRHEWPQVHHWALAPFASAEVFRVTLTDGTPAHLRPNDGSALLLPELVARGVPTPSALAQRGGWLLLSEVPGTPASDARWRADRALELMRRRSSGTWRQPPALPGPRQGGSPRRLPWLGSCLWASE